MRKTALIIYGGGSKTAIPLGILSVIHEELMPHIDMICATSAGAGLATAVITGQYDDAAYVATQALSVTRVINRPKRGLINLDLFMGEWTMKTLDRDALFASPIDFRIGVYNVDRCETQFLRPTPETLVTLLKASASLPRLTEKIHVNMEGAHCHMIDGGFADFLGYRTIRSQFPEVDRIVMVGYKPFGTKGPWLPTFVRRHSLPHLPPDHPAIIDFKRSPEFLMESWRMIEADERVLYLAPNPTEEGPVTIRLLDTAPAIRKAIVMGRDRGERALAHREIDYFFSLTSR